ncbi:MAG: class I adenylate-forming enzyme family protein [Actinomycetota bacterium]
MRFIPDKFKLLLDRQLTLSNFSQKLADMRGERTMCILHEPLRYRDFPLKLVSYLDAAHFAYRVSGFLREIGVRPGERVALCTSNNADLPMSIMGTIASGAVAVPLNFMLKAEEMRYIVENCGAETLIVDPEVLALNIRKRDNLPTIKRWVMAGPREECPDGFISLDEGLSAVGEATPADLDPDDPVAIFYTSGTTGYPKGAVMSSCNLITAQKIAAAILPVGPRSKGLYCLPAAHVMGFGCIIMGCCVGLEAYYMRHFSPREALEAMVREGVNLFVGVPAMYAMMLAEGIDKYDLSNLKMLGSAADAMPEELVEVFRRKGSFIKLGPLRIKAFFAEVYGMVELAGTATLKMAFPGIKYSRGCVGWPVWPVRVRILDENGNPLPPGEIGEVAVSGPGVTKGYWNDPEATRELISGGWLRTGDMGKKDRLGRLYFVDRKKDVIKCGGYSVFSVEVEKEVLTHPALSDAAVIGVPHPTKGEVPVAEVTLKPGTQASDEEILQWCREHIAGYKCPRVVRIIQPEEMPYGATLKVRKLELRRRFADLYTENSPPCNDQVTISTDYNKAALLGGGDQPRGDEHEASALPLRGTALVLPHH